MTSSASETSNGPTCSRPQVPFAPCPLCMTYWSVRGLIYLGKATARYVRGVVQKVAAKLAA